MVKESGLSPRVRGNLLLLPLLLLALRSIPACAGEPLPPLSLLTSREVYPRVCGGTRLLALCSSSFPGLSPRVRGNLVLPQPDTGARGSIPACAGEPFLSAAPQSVARVYPRVCGGTLLPVTGMMAIGGLSPRVRGNPPPLVILRFRGGLSPRVRGNLPHRDPRVCRKGSIPACAGEPAAGTGDQKGAGVYPRVCGGTLRLHATRADPGGLSPRVRGNLLRVRVIRKARGSIPACAGEPPAAGQCVNTLAVYPRVCGGTCHRS